MGISTIRKKTISLLLAFAFVAAAGLPGSAAAGTREPATANILQTGQTETLPATAYALPAAAAPPVARPTASTVLVDGKDVTFDAYIINGNNYFKLRDLAYAINGTQKQFEVIWDAESNAIRLTSSAPYTIIGGEMTGKGEGEKTPNPTASTIYLNGRSIELTAYTIGGNNYFKLRDVGQTFDFGVIWDAENETVIIDTAKGYIEAEQSEAAGEQGDPDEGEGEDEEEYVAGAYSKSYFDAPQGSAKFLEGRNLLVSVFVSVGGTAWTEAEISKAAANLAIAADFIASEGKKYGKTVELIYDFRSSADLRYDMKYEGDFFQIPSDGAFTPQVTAAAQKTNEDMHAFIEERIPYDTLADKYRTDSIGYVVFVNAKGWEYATPYRYGYDSIERYHERAVIFAGNDGVPSEYAHEILHMYGAVELYVAYSYDGVSAEFVEYVATNCPDDIMRVCYQTRTRISNVISPATAYCIGWLDSIPEQEQFPMFKKEIKAAFVIR